MFISFFQQKTAYEMRISDWSSDVCSSDLRNRPRRRGGRQALGPHVRPCASQAARIAARAEAIESSSATSRGRRSRVQRRPASSSRLEETRVGDTGGTPSQSWWSPYISKKKLQLYHPQPPLTTAKIS